MVISIEREFRVTNIPDNPTSGPVPARTPEGDVGPGRGEVVSFDLHFIEPRVAKDDAAFAEAMKKARNVVLTEAIRTKDILLPEGDGSSESSSHNVVRVIPPIERFSKAAVATAPFTLPRIPFMVSQFFTFEPGAGDSPSVPMVMIQLYGAKAYGDFIRLLEKASPAQAGKFPRDPAAAIEAGAVRDQMKKIREVFASDPPIADENAEGI